MVIPVAESKPKLIPTAQKETLIRVLHVDDEPSLLKTTKQILESIGSFQVETALSIKEAVKKLDEEEFDIIISDYKMPVKNGLEFLRELRENGNKVPLILFTGKGREEVAIEALNLGASLYCNKMGKPQTVYGELAYGIQQVFEKKRAEEALRRETEMLEVVTQNVGAGLTVISKDYKILWANKLLKDVMGDIEGKTCYSTLNNLTHICPGCGVKEIFETGKNQVVHEQEVPGSDGQKIWVEIVATPIRDEKRNITAALELSIGITERKKAEENLKKSEKEKSAVLDSMSELVIHQDLKHRILWVNRKAADSINMEVEQLKGRYCYEMWAESANPCTACPLEEAIKRGQPQQGEITTPDGRVWFISGYPLRDVNGKVTSVVEVVTNITGQKNAEKALRESEKNWGDSFNSLEDVMIIVNRDYTIEKINDSGLKLLGKTREEVAEKKCYQLIHGLDTVGDFCPFKRTLKTGKAESVERYEKTFGKYFSIKSSPISNERGEIARFVDLIRDITERKKAEEALRESEEKYRELLNGMNDTAWVIDFDGRFVDVNDAAVKVLGYSREELLSMGPCDIDNSLTAEEIKALVKGMPADEVQVFETAHTTKDGKTIPVEISSSLVTYQGKQAILSIARNITERKRAEKKLRQSEEKYRTVFENTGTAMCIIEEDKTISMINRQFEELSGYSQKEIEGKKWTEFVTKEYLERMKRYHEARRKLGGKAPKHYNFDFINKKGQIRNCLLTVNLIPGTKKSVASILDITKSKKTEKALREAEEKYRETIVNANVGIIGYSPEGEVKVLNPKMEQMTGFKRSEIPTLQDWFKKLYPNEEERRKIRDKWFKRMSEEGEVKKGHAIITTKDGKRRNFLFNGVRLESGDSIAFAEDITERKEAEKKLDEMMNELVAINEKLGVVGKLTRHDARNKLSVIANNVYLAKQKLAANHTTLEYLGDIESAIDQMEEIFDFARTYEMLGVEELFYMNVKKSVNEAAMLFSGMNRVKLVNECQGLTVMADSLLRQLFYNLIDDTLKHGEKVSQIRVYYEEGADQLKLIYEDDGIGIPEDEKEKIFKEGYGKGTGYGLYLIMKICEAYGWTIRETGKSGKGAQFTMTIPKTNYQLQ